MSRRIHDLEADTSCTVVRALLDEQCSQWAGLVPQELLTSGTDNAMWRLDPTSEQPLVVRLPRTVGAAVGLRKELTVLPAVADHLPVRVPTVVYAGLPADVFPHPWAVLDWAPSVDAWTARESLGDRPGQMLAEDLARTIVAIGAVAHVDSPTGSSTETSSQATCSSTGDA